MTAAAGASCICTASLPASPTSTLCVIAMRENQPPAKALEWVSDGIDQRTPVGARVDRCLAVVLPAVEAGLRNRCATVVVASGWVMACSGDLAVDGRTADREQVKRRHQGDGPELGGR